MKIEDHIRYNLDFLEEAARQMEWALDTINALGGFRDYESAEALNEYLRSLFVAADYVPGKHLEPDKDLIQCIFQKSQPSNNFG